MANNIKLLLSIEDGGTFKVVTKNAKGTSTAVDGVTKSTKRLNSATSHHNKQQKGVAGATANSTKAFSKMTTGISGGLVPAYAVLAANIFALTAAFGALSRASQLGILREGLEFTGNAAGVNLGKVAEGLKDITGAAVSAKEALSTVALGVSAGFSTEQLEGLTKVAKGASLALGRDMEDALSRLARGAAKLEPEILDELGIMVRLDDATETYAATIGKTAADLSQFERRQAFVNAIITQGEKKFGALSEAIEASPYDQLASTFKDVTEKGLKFFNFALGPIVKILGQSDMALVGVLVLFGSTIAKAIVPSLDNMTKSALASANALGHVAAQQLSNVSTMTAASKAVTTLQSRLEGEIRAHAKRALVIEKADIALKKGMITRGKYLMILKKQDALVAKATVTTKNWASALNGATLSLETNRRHLATMRLDAATDIALINRKKDLIKESTLVVNALTRSLFEQRQAQLSLMSVTAISLIQQGKWKAGMLLQINITKMQIAVTWQAVKASAGLGTAHIAAAGAARIAATAFKFLGTALASAIPVIGTVIITLSLLKDFIFPLFASEATTLSEALKDAEDQTEQFAKTNKQLVDFLGREGVTNVDAFGATIRAMAGELREGAGILENIYDSMIEQQQIKILKMQKNLSILAKIMSVSGMLGANLNDVIKFDLSEEFEQLDAIHFLNTSKGQVNSLKEKLFALSGTAGMSAQSMNYLTNVISAFEGQINLATGGTELTKESIERITAAAKAAEISVAEMFSVIEGAASLQQDVNALFVGINKTTGPLSERVDLLRRLAGAVEASKGVPEALAGLDASFTKFGTTPKAIDNFLDKVEKLNERLNVSARVLKEAQKSAKDMQMGAVEDRLKAELSIQSALEGNISAQVEYIALLKEGTVLKGQAETKLQDYQKQRFSSILKGAQIELKYAIKLQKIAQTTLKFQHALQKAREVADTKRIKNAQVLQSIAAGRGGRLTDAEEYANAVRISELQINTAERQGELLNARLEGELLVLEMYVKRDGYISASEQRLLNSLHEQIKLQKQMSDQRIAGAKAEASTTALSGFDDSKFNDRNKFAETPKSALLIGGGIKKAAEAARAIAEADLKAQEAAMEKAGSIYSAVYIEASEAAEAAKKRIAETNSIIKQTFLTTMYEGIQPFIESLRALGPDGELVAAIAEGSLSIVSSLETIGSSTATTADKLAAVANIVGSIMGMVAAASAAKIAGIDNEIAAEKKRDGQSAQSIAKLASLEKKKESAKKKAFGVNKKLMMAQAVMATAAGVAGALGMVPFGPWNIAMAAIIAALGAAQVGIIAGTSYQGGSSSAASVPSSVSVGERSNTVDLAKSSSPSGEIAYMRGEQGTGTGANNFVPSPGRAAGGNVAFPVGEQGPELFIPDRPGTIIPAGETAGAGGAPLNVSFQINTIDSENMEMALVKQRGNIIKMIREAANDTGEFFLENVSTYEDEARL